jgi:hypothetical protein
MAGAAIIGTPLSEVFGIRAHGVVRDITNFAPSQFAGDQQHVGYGFDGGPSAKTSISSKGPGQHL